MQMQLMYAHETIAEVTQIAYAPGREMAPIYTLGMGDPRKGSVYGKFKSVENLEINPDRQYKIICEEVRNDIKRTVRFAQLYIIPKPRFETDLTPGEYVFTARSFSEKLEPITYRAFRKMARGDLTTDGENTTTLRDQYEFSEGSSDTVNV